MYSQSVPATVPQIITEDVVACLFCRVPGRRLYTGLYDRLFDAPGRWNLLTCPRCGFVWLSPRPVPSEISKVYQTYFTHYEVNFHWWTPLIEKARRALYAASVPGYSQLADGIIWKALGRVLSWSPWLKDHAALGTMLCTDGRKGKILDVGCGDGSFLRRMRDAGWDVTGVEPDPAAVARARERYGIPAILGSLDEAELPEASFDAITLSHVIEHVHDPVALLARCRHLLRPTGKVVVVTPNVESLGHQEFGASWVALDPPRHLYLFSPKTLEACFEMAGLRVQLLRTSARIARWNWQASETIRLHSVFRDSCLTWRRRLHGFVFQALEEVQLRRSTSTGEELALVGSTVAAPPAQGAY